MSSLLMCPTPYHARSPPAQPFQRKPSRPRTRQPPHTRPRRAPTSPAAAALACVTTAQIILRAIRPASTVAAPSPSVGTVTAHPLAPAADAPSLSVGPV